MISKRNNESIRAGLARWLAEWQMDQILRMGVTAEPAGRTITPWTQGRQPESDPEPATGQIRLLYPDRPATSSRLVYLTLLEQTSTGAWLAAPFSRFSEPALPGEWKTGRTAPGLRVLCLWNARAVPAQLLARSWLADRLEHFHIICSLPSGRLNGNMGA